MKEKRAIVVDAETAEVEYSRFLYEMDLKIDPTKMDAEDKTAYDKQKEKIIDAIQEGALVVNEKGEAVYAARNPDSKHRDPITFHERDGSSLMAMDNKKKNQDVAKTYAVMASMCEVHPKVFAGMKGIDVKTCEALFALLMD